VVHGHQLADQFQAWRTPVGLRRRDDDAIDQRSRGFQNVRIFVGCRRRVEVTDLRAA
jgi:hypothetical protein